MLNDVVFYFKCPKCYNKELRYSPQGLHCINCKMNYPISNEVIDFLQVKKSECINGNNVDVSDAIINKTIDYLSLEHTENMFQKVKNIYMNSKKYNGDDTLNCEMREISERLGFNEDDVKNTSYTKFFQNNTKNYCISFEKHYFLDPLPPNKSIFRNIRIKNLGDTPLSSNYEYPLYISYHLYDCNNNLIEWDGERTKLPIDIQPNNSITIPLKVNTPNTNGNFILHVCFVEENNQWFDDISIRIPIKIDSKNCTSEFYKEIKFSTISYSYVDDHKLALNLLNEYIEGVAQLRIRHNILC